MKLTEQELLIIHDHCKHTLPFIKVLFKRGEDAYVTRSIGRLNRLRLKCRKELVDKYDYGSVWLDADDR